MVTQGELSQSMALVSEWDSKNHNREAEVNLPRSISRVHNRSQPGSQPASSTSTPRPTAHLSVSTTPVVAVRDGNLSPPMSALSPPPQSYVPPEALTSTHQTRPPATGFISCPPHHMEQSSFVQAPLIPPPSSSRPNAPLADTYPFLATDDRFRKVKAVGIEETKPVPLPIGAPVKESQQSASPAEPFESITPMAMPVDDPITIVSPPPVEQGSLKRLGISMVNMEEFPTQKKPRLDAEVQKSDSSSTGPVTAVMDPPIATEEKKIDDDDEGSDDEEVEVRTGPDGLRLVDDCLPALIEDDEQNGDRKRCRLCT
ncbi:hypothetical protein C0991_003964 [Blastosporella zonata]|nr:hypothetical protein C0991_003964 [Blastosporella zonata]